MHLSSLLYVPHLIFRDLLAVIIFGEKKVMGLERGSLSLVSTTEELLGRKVAAPV
jgi:hypothetical protein